ncbi:hypothetical protein [Saccharothrix hoggarensis]|uniref:Uncharacterized protein n=1 Tax=Saccharothrix hoggarensis TaxID=913853 RepID=A0ABW3QLF7_9PSEU
MTIMPMPAAPQRRCHIAGRPHTAAVLPSWDDVRPHVHVHR